MKTLASSAVAALCCTAMATLSSNDVATLKADWNAGRYTNVCAWADARLATDPGDIPALLVKVEYLTWFGDRQVISNAVSSLMAASAASTHPAYTNLYSYMEQDWSCYLEVFLPSQTEADRIREQAKLPAAGLDFVSEGIISLFMEEEE